MNTSIAIEPPPHPLISWVDAPGLIRDKWVIDLRGDTKANAADDAEGVKVATRLMLEAAVASIRWEWMNFSPEPIKWAWLRYGWGFGSVKSRDAMGSSSFDAWLMDEIPLRQSQDHELVTPYIMGTFEQNPEWISAPSEIVFCASEPPLPVPMNLSLSWSDDTSCIVSHLRFSRVGAVKNEVRWMRLPRG